MAVVKESIFKSNYQFSPKQPIRFYFSGTCYNKKNTDELIAKLYHADTSDDKYKHHYNGPGKRKHRGYGFQALKRFTGVIDGARDMKKNTNAAKEHLLADIKSKLDQGQKNIQIFATGWSRGAVTAIMFTKSIQDIKDNLKDYFPDYDISDVNIEANLLVIDPVPGITNTFKPNNKDIKGKMTSSNVSMEIPPVVSNVKVIYAGDEKTPIFTPVDLIIKDRKATSYSKTVLPGIHASLVELKSGKKKFDKTTMVVQEIASYMTKPYGVNLSGSTQALEKETIENIKYLYDNSHYSMKAKNRQHIKSSAVQNNSLLDYLVNKTLQRIAPNIMSMLHSKRLYKKCEKRDFSHVELQVERQRIIDFADKLLVEKCPEVAKIIFQRINQDGMNALKIPKNFHKKSEDSFKSNFKKHKKEDSFHNFNEFKVLFGDIKRQQEQQSLLEKENSSPRNIGVTPF